MSDSSEKRSSYLPLQTYIRVAHIETEWIPSIVFAWAGAHGFVNTYTIVVLSHALWAHAPLIALLGHGYAVRVTVVAAGVLTFIITLFVRADCTAERAGTHQSHYKFKPSNK